MITLRSSRARDEFFTCQPKFVSAGSVESVVLSRSIIVFSPSIETLLAFLEGNPLVEKGALAEKHLGITASKREDDKNSNEIRSLARDLFRMVKDHLDNF